MHIVKTLDQPLAPGPAVVTVGTFDGVHAGHQAILRAAVQWAREAGMQAVCLTFSNHPRAVLPGREPPELLTTPEERLRLIAHAGIDCTVMPEFTAELSQKTAEEFVREILLGRLHARNVVLGFNSKFGRGGKGDVEFLQHRAGEFGVAVRSVPPVIENGAPVSSTKIRHLLAEGELARANRKLGRPYRLSGTVARGDGRGHALGFPTANLEALRTVIPADGVYACAAWHGRTRHAAVVNIGVRPTFGQAPRAVEAHVLDFSGDLYGQTIDLDFHARLRDEKKFGSKEALTGQIAADVAVARGILQSLA